MPLWRSRLPILIAVLLTLVAWGRFAYVALAHTPPGDQPRLINGPEGTHDYRCNPPHILEGDWVWYYPCYVYFEPNGVQMHVGRVNLATNTVELLGRINEDIGAEVVGFARHGDQTLIVLETTGAPYLNFRMLTEGQGAESLPTPEGVIDASQLVGVFWQSDTLHAVTFDVRERIPAHSILTPGGAWDALDVPQPECADDQLCILELAYPAEDGEIQYWYSRAPLTPNPDTLDEVTAEIVRVTEAGGEVEAQMLEIDPLREAASGQPGDSLLLGHFELNDAGEFDWYGTVFDRTPGNVIDTRFFATPFVLLNGRWQAPELPPGRNDATWDGDYYNLYISPFGGAAYVVEEGQLRWQPVAVPQDIAPVPDEQVVLIDGRWLRVAYGEAGVFAEEVGRGAGRPFIDRRYSSFAASNFAGTLMPAVNGGYWFFGDLNGAFRLDESLNRVGAPNIMERVSRIFGNFNAFGGSIGDQFFRDQPVALKQVVFPLLLLFVPVTFALAQAWARRREVSALPALARLSWVYMVVFALGVSWFWTVTAVL